MHKRNNERLKMAKHYSSFVNHKHATCVLTRGNFKNYPQFPGVIYSNCCIKEEMYIDVVRCLKDAVRRKRPEKRKTSNRFLLHDNTPAHQPVLVKYFFAENNVTTLDRFPYPPDLAPADLYPFPWMKSGLKKRRFWNAIDIIKNATEELKRFSQNDFQECFQHLYSRWRKCVIAQGDYFEGSVVQMMYCFVFLKNKVILLTLKLPGPHLLSQNTYHPFEASETAHLRRCVHRCHAVLGPHVQRSASLGNKEFEHLEVALLRRQIHRCNVVVHLRVGAATYITWHHTSSWRRQFKLPPYTPSPRSRPSAVSRKLYLSFSSHRARS